MPGKRIKDAGQLNEELVWVLFTYRDGSQFCFQTTLSRNILRERGVVLEEGKLVRLDKKYYVNGKYVYRQFPFADVSISLWDDCTYTHEPSARMHEFL